MMLQTERTIRLFLCTLAVSLYVVVPGVVYGQNKRNASSNTPAPNAESSSKPLTARQIVDKVLPSLVVVVAQDENGEPIRQGSGFFYKPGLVATNLHVFTRASRAYVKVLNGGINYKVAEVVGMDMRRDLCVVRVDDNSTPPLVLNGANSPAVGDEIFVVSNPKGLEGSVSKGIVSGVRKDIGLLQIDAAISPGSSGGAVVNDRAEVVGVAVSSIVSGQNLNFAVPAEYLATLKLSFKVPVVVAGALSLKDRDKEKLRGLVRGVAVTRAYFRYDKLSEKDFEEPAKMVERIVFDLDGNEIERWDFIDGELITRFIYSYDQNGFKTRNTLEHGGTRDEYEITQADSISEKIKQRMFSSSSETQIDKHVYDREGNEIESTLKLTTGLEKRLFAYDRNDFVTEESIYLNDKLQSIYRSTYETDEHGNWIKRYETRYDTKYPALGFTPAAVTYREIRYFGQQ